MKSESRRSGSLLPRFRQLCTTAPEGVSPCGIDGDVSRDTPALAFGVTVPFSRSHHPTPERRATLRPRNRPASAEPTLTSASTTPAEGRGRQERPCQSDPKRFSGRIGDTTGCRVDLQAGTANFCAPALVSPPMGSSGSKKNRKGKRPPAPGQGGDAGGERPHPARGRARRGRQLRRPRARAGVFWVAVVVIVDLRRRRDRHAGPALDDLRGDLGPEAGPVPLAHLEQSCRRPRPA